MGFRMSRPRTPTKVLRMRGAFDRNPKRGKEREHEPQVDDPLGEPPDGFDEAQAARWRELAVRCPWLTVADRTAVEVVCRLWMTMRAGQFKAADYVGLMNCLGRLGMTPVDRSKVRMPGAKNEKKSLLA